MAASTLSVLLCGVGGQGTILAADLLAKTAMASGCDVKLSEIHGMSQRGGSVTTMVCFGDEVASPVIGPGCADRIVSFEIIEALRNLFYLGPEGCILVNDEVTIPLPVLMGAAEMPSDPHKALLDRGALFIPARDKAEAIGNPKGANVVLMGALSAQLPFEASIWEEVISKRVPPKTIEVNLKAFHEGRGLVL